MVKCLRQNGFSIVELGSMRKGYLGRFCELLIKVIRINRSTPDIVFVGFYGQPLVPLIRLFYKGPLIFDAFLSTFDTLCQERKKFKNPSVMCSLCKKLDEISCRKSDLVLLDTEAHIDFFSNTFGMEKEKFRRVFVGVDTDIFKPIALGAFSHFTVFFHGTYRPLHGIDVIVKAAALLSDLEDLRFVLVGTGPERKKINRLVLEKGVKNITFKNWIDQASLPQAIADSDVCLGGHFSTIPKASRTIAGKTFQYLAMGRPVIVGRNRANEELLREGIDCLMCDMGSPQELAQSIRLLYNDRGLGKRISENGMKRVTELASLGAIAIDLGNAIEALNGGSSD
ncbi:MAG: glycosyltransferase [Candidatus Syntropharchaeales archaeon]